MLRAVTRDLQHNISPLLNDKYRSLTPYEVISNVSCAIYRMLNAFFPIQEISDDLRETRNDIGYYTNHNLTFYDPGNASAA